MPRTRTADRARKAGRTQRRDDVIAVSGRSHPLGAAAVARVAARVLTAERQQVLLSVTFVGRDRMRGLNRRWKGRDAPTDVLAFPLAGPDGRRAGDIYICPWMAAKHARSLGLPIRQELTRLVIHGVLHVLGYAHPEAAGRTASPMWRRQERYLRSIR